MQQIGKNTISALELAVLLLVIRIVEPTTFFSMIDYQKGTGSWLATLFTFPIGITAIWLYSKMLIKLGDRNFISYIRQRFGKIAAIIVGILFIFDIFVLSIIAFREIGDVITTFFLIETPIIIIIIIMVLLAIQASFYGLPVITRISLLIMPFLAVMLLLILILTAGEVDILNIVPFMEEGINSIAKSGVYLFSRLNEFTILFIIGTFVRDKEKLFPYLVVAFTLDMLVTMTAIIYVYGIFGRVQGNNLVFEFLEVARLVSTQIDIISISGWILINFVQTATYFYCFNLLLLQTFDLKTSNLLLLPTGLICMNMAMAVYSNTRERSEYITGAGFPYQLTMILLPLVLFFLGWLVSSIKKRAG